MTIASGGSTSGGAVPVAICSDVRRARSRKRGAEGERGCRGAMLAEQVDPVFGFGHGGLVSGRYPPQHVMRLAHPLEPLATATQYSLVCLVAIDERSQVLDGFPNRHVHVKIVHTWRAQEVRFGCWGAAERYASRYGGLRAWRVVPVPRIPTV